MHWEVERQKKKACLTLTTAEKQKNVELCAAYSFCGGHLEIHAENKRKNGTTGLLTDLLWSEMIKYSSVYKEHLIAFQLSC